MKTHTVPKRFCVSFIQYKTHFLPHVKRSNQRLIHLILHGQGLFIVQNFSHEKKRNSEEASPEVRLQENGLNLSQTV